MLGSLSSTPKALLLGAVLLAAGFAGCASSTDGGDTFAYSSYQDARNATGTTWEANNTNSPIKLKLLEPSSTTVTTGTLNLTFLLYDSETNEPVKNANFVPQSEYSSKCSPSHSFCAKMPNMGHGTSPEESPHHVKYGVYQGTTTISMPNWWRINVNPEIDGQVIEYDIDLHAQGEDGGNHGN